MRIVLSSLLMFPFLLMVDHFGLLQVDDCNKFVQQKIWAGAVNVLQKRGLDPAKLEKTPIPQG